MRIKSTTIQIEEEWGSGHIHIRVNIEQPDGQTSNNATITNHTIGRKVEAVVDKIREILKECKNDGTLEG